MPERAAVSRYLSIAGVLLLIIGIAAWQLWARYQTFLETPLQIPDEGRVFVLTPGSSGSAIVDQLTEQGFTRPGWQWRLLMRLEPDVYRSGEYRLESGMVPQDVLELFSSGRVLQYRLTLVEGWTFAQVADLLARNEVLEHDLDLTDPGQWETLQSLLDIAHPEGWFLPETYQFSRGDSDLDILGRAHFAMREALARAWASRASCC